MPEIGTVKIPEARRHPGRSMPAVPVEPLLADRLGRDICADLATAERREWLVTNGIGGYASGMVAGRRRTRRTMGGCSYRFPIARGWSGSSRRCSTKKSSCQPMASARSRAGMRNSPSKRRSRANGWR
jgi:hypothetical protein